MVIDPIIMALRDERLHRLNFGPINERSRWTQVAVAGRLGTMQNTLSNWELGVRKPDVSRVREWAALFGLTVKIVSSPEAHEHHECRCVA